MNINGACDYRQCSFWWQNWLTKKKVVLVIKQEREIPKPLLSWDTKNQLNISLNELLKIKLQTKSKCLLDAKIAFGTVLVLRIFISKWVYESNDHTGTLYIPK